MARIKALRWSWARCSSRSGEQSRGILLLSDSWLTRWDRGWGQRGGCLGRRKQARNLVTLHQLHKKHCAVWQQDCKDTSAGRLTPHINISVL